MTDAPSLCLASRDDASAIACMSRDLIEEGLGWSWTPSRVRRSIDDRGSNVLLARAGAATIGFGIMKYHDDEAHLLLLAVDPEHARAGIGSGLVAWLEVCARTAGIGQVYVEARAANAGARAFYRRIGYGEIQMLPGYYRGVEASVRMAKDLWLEQSAPA